MIWKTKMIILKKTLWKNKLSSVASSATGDSLSN